MKKNYLLWIIIYLWSVMHLFVMQNYLVLNNADDFAYLQMASHLADFDIAWFGSWWFWFLYSLPIALFKLVFQDNFISAFLINIILFAITALLLFKLSRKILSKNFSLIAIIFLYLSPFLLNFNIHVLSENIYIPLFLWLLINLEKLYSNFNYKNIILISFNLTLLYLTRAEAFIYIWSVWLYLLAIFFHHKNINFTNIFKKWLVLVAGFFVFISPYIFYLYSFTWEIWLTNKWASNFRQAQMRWIEKQDDIWFERAVWELTEDNHHLIAGFAWGLDYDKPNIKWWVLSSIINNPGETIIRQFTNQKKVLLEAIPRITIWEGLNRFLDEKSSLYKFRYLVLFLSWVVLLVFAYWLILLFINRKYSVFYPYFLTFLTAFIFFTIFFVILRYFVIFLPLFYTIFLYGLENIIKKFRNIYSKIVSAILIWFLLLISAYWCLAYNNNLTKLNDKYLLKKQAWLYLKDKYKNSENNEELKIMERFPIVTYYSWTLKRILTPYSDNFDNILEYARYNNIDYLIVDTMDFLSYRPQFKDLLDTKNKINWLKVESIFKDSEWAKVIIYKFDFQ